MRITRLYIPQPLQEDTTLAVSGQPAHHVRNVLRLRAGATLRLFNGSGREHAATLLEAGRSAITLAVAAPVEPVAPPSLRIMLAQGIARNDRMDLILQKAVELGVAGIQPLWMRRSQKHLKGERLEKRLRHWRGIVISACEQCGRASLPGLAEPMSFADWQDNAADTGLRLILQPEGRRTLRELDKPENGVMLLVGPEGGLTPEERTGALRTGFTGIRLGQRILRTETAGIAALAGIQALWGDFS